MPATRAIARTAMNVRACGKTPFAGLSHAIVILLFMLIAAPLAGYLALPALAAVLMLTAWNMSDPHNRPTYMKLRLSDRVLMVLTLVLTVVVEPRVAIDVGVSIGLVLRLGRRQPPQDCYVPDR